MTKYILGIDIGTSSTKGMLITTTGEVIKQAKASYDLQTPHPNWAQEEASDWLNAVSDVITQLVADIDGTMVEALGLDGLYGGSGIPVDSEGKVLGPALIWMDRRATKETELVKSLVSEQELMDTTANLVDPYYGFTKLLWLKEHEPEMYQATAQFLPPESYVISQLTGEISINYSAAGNLAGVYDIEHAAWSTTLADKLGLDITKLPQKFVTSTQIAGHLLPEWAEKLHLPADMPVFNTGVDVGPATVGTGILEPGKVTIALGTSMNAALVTKQPQRNNGLIVWPYAYKPAEYFYNFAGANTAGAIIAWFTKEFAPELGENATVDLDAMSANIPIGSNGLIVLPFFMGERSPLWDSTVRGTVLGISLKTTRAELYNAFQEALAYSVRQSIELFGEEVGDEITLVGGVSRSDKMLHLIADVTGKTVLTTQSGGEANLGSAILAGIGVGVVNPEDVSDWIKIDQAVTPDINKHGQYNHYFKAYTGAYQSVRGWYADFAEIQ